MRQWDTFSPDGDGSDECENSSPSSDELDEPYFSILLNASVCAGNDALEFVGWKGKDHNQRQFTLRTQHRFFERVLRVRLCVCVCACVCVDVCVSGQFTLKTQHRFFERVLRVRLCVCVCVSGQFTLKTQHRFFERVLRVRLCVCVYVCRDSSR
jgi:hypothetical protein